MVLFRGILMLAAGIFVLYEGWVHRLTRPAWPFYGLGILAIGLGIYRIARRKL